MHSPVAQPAVQRRSADNLERLPQGDVSEPEVEGEVILPAHLLTCVVDRRSQPLSTVARGLHHRCHRWQMQTRLDFIGRHPQWLSLLRRCHCELRPHALVYRTFGTENCWYRVHARCAVYPSPAQQVLLS